MVSERKIMARIRDIAPPPPRSGFQTLLYNPRGRWSGGGTGGGGSEGGRTPGRGSADRDQGGDEGGRSQGRDRRDPEQEEPSWTQAIAITAAHGGADGGRSHGGGMATDSRGRPTAAEQVVEELKVETESQRARRMPRIRGVRVEPSDRGGGRDPEIRG